MHRYRYVPRYRAVHCRKRAGAAPKPSTRKEDEEVKHGEEEEDVVDDHTGDNVGDEEDDDEDEDEDNEEEDGGAGGGGSKDTINSHKRARVFERQTGIPARKRLAYKVLVVFVTNDLEHGAGMTNHVLIYLLFAF
jgi:hypothetical protein